MKRRFLCILLTLVMLVSLIPLAAVTASAAYDMTASEDAIAILKKMEGFTKYAKWDYSQYSIGYGSACKPSDYPNGITEAEADKLLRIEVVKIEGDINTFASRNKLSLSQNQFDALMLFSYNCGTNWMKGEGFFIDAVINGYTGNDFLFPITLWSTAGDSISVGLVERRLAEADLYMNGSYVTTGGQRSNYTYVLLDSNGGNKPVVVRGSISNNCEVQGYDSSLPTIVEPVPTRTGYRFMGWYTAKDGGSWITNLDASTAEKTLYAQWQKGEGNVDASGNILGTAASYTRPAGAAMSLNIYKNPGSRDVVTGTFSISDTLTITAEYVDKSSNKWGKLASGGWVDLGSTTDPVYSGLTIEVTVTNTFVNVRQAPGAGSALLGTLNKGDKLYITEVTTNDGQKWGKVATGGWIALMYTDFEIALENATGGSNEPIATGKVVCGDYLNVRSGAGVGNAQVGALVNGTEVKIYEITTVNGHEWGRIHSGWICMDYVVLDEEPGTDEDTGKDEEPDTEEIPEGLVATGTVTVGDLLNVRSGPGVNYAKVGTMVNGEKVYITEITTVNAHEWGKTEKGWICLDYVNLVMVDQPEEPEETEPEETEPEETEPEDTKPEETEPEETEPEETEPEDTKPEETEPEETEPEETEPEAPKYSTGVVANADVVNVRTAAGCTNPIAAKLKQGTKVTIYEQVTKDNAPWARIDEGWICMYYVKLDQQSPDEIVGSGDKVAATGIVYNTDELNIRSGPGTNYAKVGVVSGGTEVKIYEQTTVNGTIWGRIDQGWICLNYVLLNSTGSGEVKGQMGTVVGCYYTLNIRSAPGTFNALVGTVLVNSRVEIYEIVTLNGEEWGRIDQGWVCMRYIQLDSELPPVPDVPDGTPTEPEETEPEETEPEETEPEETEPEEDEEPGVIEYLTGTVINAPNGLKIRAGAGTGYKQVGTLSNDTEVKIYATEVYNGLAWGMTEDGWICLSYVQIDPISEDGIDVWIVAGDNLNVRTGPGTNYSKVTTYDKGTIVEIYDTAMVGNTLWGLTAYGWISSAYVQ